MLTMVFSVIVYASKHGCCMPCSESPHLEDSYLGSSSPIRMSMFAKIIDQYPDIRISYLVSYL